MTEPTNQQRRRLRAHFGFARMPFHKAMELLTADPERTVRS